MDLSEVLQPEEVLDLDQAFTKMLDSHVIEALDRMARREAELLADPRFGKDSEMREITLWNVAALCAASERLSQVRTTTPGTRSGPDSTRGSHRSGSAVPSSRPPVPTCRYR